MHNLLTSPMFSNLKKIFQNFDQKWLTNCKLFGILNLLFFLIPYLIIDDKNFFEHCGSDAGQVGSYNEKCLGSSTHGHLAVQ